MRPSRWTLDAVMVAALLGVALGYARFLTFDRPPFEDAAMIMRYAEHLAAGHGIVWNIGQAPVDGATDFLFLVVIAALRRLGVAVDAAVRGVTLTSHLATVAIVYLASRRLWNAPIPVAFFLGWYLAAGTGLSYVTSFFGTPFFALFATTTWWLALHAIKTREAPFRLALWFSLSGLITGLIRPEGVILAALMAGAVWLANGWPRSRVLLTTFAAVFLVLGGAYFVWRWSYFGYPFPNPYYKKGAATLHWASLQVSLLGTARFAWPLLPVFALGFRSAARARMVTAALLPPLAFAAAFIMISNEMNFGGRFQYVTLPLILLAWVLPIDDLIGALGRLWSSRTRVPERAAWALAAAAAAFMMVRYSAAQRCVFLAAPEVCYGSDLGAASGGFVLYEVGETLAKYRDKGYVLATTEAGLLPYYSGWTSIDTWGLNDQWIAHHGGVVTAEYLDRWQPSVIMSHAYFSPTSRPERDPQFMNDAWNRMTITLRDYAVARGYRLVAAFGFAPQNLHYFYVKPDLPDGDRIGLEIRNLVKERPGMVNYADTDATPAAK